MAATTTTSTRRILIFIVIGMVGMALLVSQLELIPRGGGDKTKITQDIRGANNNVVGRHRHRREEMTITQEINDNGSDSDGHGTATFHRFRSDYDTGGYAHIYKVDMVVGRKGSKPSKPMPSAPSPSGPTAQPTDVPTMTPVPTSSPGPTGPTMIPTVDPDPPLSPFSPTDVPTMTPAPTITAQPTGPTGTPTVDSNPPTSPAPVPSSSSPPVGTCILHKEEYGQSRHKETLDYDFLRGGSELEYELGELCTYRGEYVPSHRPEDDGEEEDGGEQRTLAAVTGADDGGITVCCKVDNRATDPLRDGDDSGVSTTPPSSQCAPCRDCEDCQFVNDGCCSWFFWDNRYDDRRLNGIFTGGCIHKYGAEHKCCKCSDHDYRCTTANDCETLCNGW